MSIAASTAIMIVDALNASGLCTATMVYDPTVPLESLSTRRVVVVPSSLTVERQTRDTHRFEAVCDIAIQARLPDGGDVAAAIEEQMGLADGIAFILPSIGAEQNVQHVTTEIPALYSPDDLRNLRVITTVLRVTYAIVKAF